MKLLYHCAISKGGLAEYSRHQAAALVDCQDIELLWHAPEALRGPEGAVRLPPVVERRRRPGRSLARRFSDFALDTLRPFKALAHEISKQTPDAVLLSAWGEYFSPLWAPKLRRFREQGVLFGAVIHDPVRDKVRGPVWWHRRSVREAYSFLDVAFTHHSTPVDTCGGSRFLRTVQIPHGPYPVPLGEASKIELRRTLGLPERANVLLSFGHIRDGKNVDQLIAALPSLPSTHLLVAGCEQSADHKAAEYYQELAARLGVGERCHWQTDYIPHDEVWKYFRASDLLALTYAREFRSASGVLNVNAQFGLPVLASAGRSPLLEAVEKYGLGTIIGRPDAASIAEAVPRALSVRGEWDKFVEENSWRVNAGRVVQALSEMRKIDT